MSMQIKVHKTNEDRDGGNYKQNEYLYSNEEYLQDVYDALVAVMDTDKFNMLKGYNDEYECDCITIVSTDTDGTRAIIYVNDYDGRHPTAFDVVYRYPGDKGVGIMGTYEFQSTDLDETAPEIFDYFDEVSSRSATALSEEDSKKYADSLVGKEYNVDSIVSDGWEFVSDVEMHDELNRATFNANVGGRKSMLVVDYNPNTGKVVDSYWDYYAFESKQDGSSNIGKKMENVVPIGKDEVEREFISLLPDDIAWGYTRTDNGPTVFMSLNPDKYPDDERTVVMYVQGCDATDPALVTRIHTDDSDTRGHWGKMFEFIDNFENPWKQCADYVSSLLLDGVTESKQDEADYSASRVSKPIADAYSLLDGYFCDEDGRLTSDAVDKVYLTFRNERDLYDRSKSRAVKSHSLAWDALLREINATLEWDDENPHATSLTSEQVKNWFKLKGRDYKEELKPLVAVIDAYRNREY